MKCFCVYSRTVILWARIFIVLFCISNVVSQSLTHGNRGVGLPLPLLNGGQDQGRSAAGPIPFNPNFRPDNPRASLNPPLYVKFDDDSILSPRVTPGGVIPTARVPPASVDVAPVPTISSPGSLQHIQNPIQDLSVQALLKHPFVLKKIQSETFADSAVKVDSVITAHRQVVSGKITYLDVKVVKTKCSIGTHSLANCEVDVSEDPYICEVAVWERPWLKNSIKIVDEKTRCAEIENDNDFKNWNKGKNDLRRRNNEISLRQLPHFLDERQIALEAFDYINRGSESKFKGQMVNYQIDSIKHDAHLNITLVDVKVEYGFTLCLKFPNRKVDGRFCPLDSYRDNYVCSVTVMSDPNLTTNLKVIPGDDDDIDCDKKDSVDEQLVVPVQAACMGCPKPASLNDPDVMRIANFAVTEYDRQSDESELHVIIKLHKAHTQTVNGLKYFITLEIADTDCRKPLSAFNMNRTLCNQDHTETTDVCDFVILEQPWEKSIKLQSVRCVDKDDYHNSHRDEFIIPVLGSDPRNGGSPPLRFVVSPTLGRPAQNAPKPSLEIITFVLSEFNRREVDDDDDGFYKVMSIIHSSSSNEPIGEVHHIVMELGETVCTRTSRSRTLAECPLKIGEDVEVCSASVLKGPQPRLLSLECDDRDDHYRLTSNPVISPFQPVHQPFFAPKPEVLSVPGAPVQMPVNSSVVEDIARFVVDQYNLQSDEDELYKLSKVIVAFKVESTNPIFTLELEILETNCKKYQPVVDVTRCHIDPTEEPEVCQAEVASSPSINGHGTTRRLMRIFCDDREDFYVKKMNKVHGNRRTSPNKGWIAEPVTSDKMKHFGELIADEFDIRSDDDNIFVLVKVLQAKTETTGLTHYLQVELAETVCPKYKQKINKSRCAIDIGEEHKICNAKVSELPWRNDVEVKELSCMERDESREEDESMEVLYPRVHPSAHARPKFPHSRFRVRQHSKESDESNEKYYNFGRRRTHSSKQVDSDEHHHHHHARRQQPSHFRTSSFTADDDRFDDDEDSDHRHDNDSRSVESFSRRHLRSRRFAPVQDLISSPVDPADPEVLDLAAFALSQMDQLSEDKRLRRVEKVLKASKRIVSGLEWTMSALVSYTQCTDTLETKAPLSSCKPDSNEPTYICNIIIWEKPWETFKTVKESKCNPYKVTVSGS